MIKNNQKTSKITKNEQKMIKKKSKNIKNGQKMIKKY